MVLKDYQKKSKEQVRGGTGINRRATVRIIAYQSSVSPLLSKTAFPR